jgi:hypothetical protein
MLIVSGLVGGINRRPDRDLNKYIELGRELIAVQIPIVLFVSSHLVPIISGRKREDYEKDEKQFQHRKVGGVMDGMVKTYTYVQIGHVWFVYFEKTDLFLWPYRELGHKFAVATGNPSKDTLEYMFVQCQKSEWMSISASLLSDSLLPDSLLPDSLLSDVQMRVWLDFGIFHMFCGSSGDGRKRELFHSALHNMHKVGESEPTKVVFARCWDPDKYYEGDIYRDINWSFAGSVFYAREDTVIHEFACKMREKCLQILRERNTLMWEVNVWLILYRENPSLFSFYLADHNENILPRFVCE